jgi:ATPase family AAA domain-containing protein 3A/B
VLNPDTEKKLATVTIATANTRANGYLPPFGSAAASCWWTVTCAVWPSPPHPPRANFRHLMLYGPPGTGKTMFARRLAQQVRAKAS